MCAKMYRLRLKKQTDEMVVGVSAFCLLVYFTTQRWCWEWKDNGNKYVMVAKWHSVYLQLKLLCRYLMGASLNSAGVTKEIIIYR